MQKGFTSKRAVALLQIQNPGPAEERTVLIFNSSAVTIYLGDDSQSTNPDNGLPIAPNTGLPPFTWYSDLWIAADNDNTEFRFLISPRKNAFKQETITHDSLRACTPPAPSYFNRPAGR